MHKSAEMIAIKQSTGKIEYKTVKEVSYMIVLVMSVLLETVFLVINLWHHVFGRAKFKLVALSLRKCQFGRYNQISFWQDINLHFTCFKTTNVISSEK